MKMTPPSHPNPLLNQSKASKQYAARFYRPVMIMRAANNSLGTMLVTRPSRILLSSSKPVAVGLQLSARCSSLHTTSTRPLLVPPPSRSRITSTALCTPRVLLHPASTVSTHAPSAAADSPPSAASDETYLTWNRFLQLRAVRRRFNLVASVVSSAGTVTVGAAVLTTLDLDAFSANLPFGLDPVFALGLLTAGCGALGWLFGPFAGNAAFGWYYRGLRPEIAAVGRPRY